MGKLVLVVGGAGYIGSHTVNLLRKRGHLPLILDDLSTGHREAALRASKDSLFYEGDYGDSGFVEKILKENKIDAVMHFGAKALVGESVAHPDLYYSANVSGTLSLLQAMLKMGVKNFIFSSSCAVFGAPESATINEDTLKNPINPYGWSKLFIEQILKDFDRAYGFRFGVLRYFNAAGGDPEGELGEDHSPETHMIPNALQAALGLAPELLIHGGDYLTRDGSCVRDYIHVNDLADAHIKTLDFILEKKQSLALNLGSGKGMSNLEIVDAISKVIGEKLKFKVGPRRPGDPSSLVADPARALSTLNWKPQFDLQKIIETAYQWMKKNPEGYNDK